MSCSRASSGAPQIDRRRFSLSLAAAATTTLASSLLVPGLARAAMSAPEIRAIKDRGELIVGMTEFDSPPFYFTPAPHGSETKPELEGWDVSFARELAQLLDVKLTVNRTASAYNGVVDLVSAGTVDLGISKLSMTARRALVVRFSAPTMELHHALLVNRTAMARRQSDDNVRAVLNRNFDGSIGVIAKSSYAETARQIFTQAALHEFASWEDVVDAVNQDVVDLAYRDELEIKKLMRLRPELRLNLRSALITDERDPIAFALPGSSTQLLSAVNVMLAQRRRFDANELLNRYPEIFGST